MDPAAVMGNCTTSSANYESSPGQILSSLQTVLSVSLQGSEAGSPPGVPTVVPVLASQVVVTDLAAPMLAEPVSQQSVDGAARYLRWYRHCPHHDPDRLHPGQLAAEAVAPQPHPCHPVSTVPTPPTCSHWTCSSRSWSLCSPRTQRHSSLCSARCCSTASRRPPAPVSVAVSVQTDGCEDQLGVLPSGQPPGLI